MKRILDILGSLFGLLLFSPLMLVIAALVVIDSSGGVFFRGERIGLHGKPFQIIKFRSMIPDCEGEGTWNIGDNDVRLTKIGRFLRKSKLDELPQLINVLKGEMSFVGPRPELRYYIEMYTEREMPILDLKPGITDWASITNPEQYKAFTQATDPDRLYLEKIRPLKLELQLYYREHHNLWSDFKCVLWTAFKLLTHSPKLPGQIQSIVDAYERKIQNETLS